MMIEMTHARTGRSMKNRASMAGLLSRFLGRSAVCRLRDRHLDDLRLDGDARRHLLQAVDDHLLARREAAGDLPQAVMERSNAHGARDYLFVAVHDVDDLLPLVAV